MTARSILIVGSGHLAARVQSLAKARGLNPIRWDDCNGGDSTDHESRFEAIRRAFSRVELESVSAAILVDDQDDRNLEHAIVLTSMNARLPIVASMFNESIAPHLRAANPNLRVLNPARIAAQTFVTALDQPLRHGIRYSPQPPANTWAHPRRDSLSRHSRPASPWSCSQRPPTSARRNTCHGSTRSIS